MNNKPTLSELLFALSAYLQAVSERILKALLTFSVRLARIAHDIVVAIANFVVDAATSVWRLYCRLELSIVEAFATIMLRMRPTVPY
jgi:hypothetical protein